MYIHAQYIQKKIYFAFHHKCSEEKGKFVLFYLSLLIALKFRTPDIVNVCLCSAH